MYRIASTGGGMGRQDYETETLISHALLGGGFDASEDGTGRGTPIIPILEVGARTGKSTDDIRAGSGIGEVGDPMFTLQSGKQHAIAFAQNQRDEVREVPVAGALAAEPGMKQQTYIAFSSKDHGADAMDDLSPTLRAGTHDKSHANAGVPPAVTVSLRGREGGATAEIGGEQSTALRASQGGGDKPHVLAFQPKASVSQSMNPGEISPSMGTSKEVGAMIGSAVRRLTPRECERLQGFPDEYTLVPFRGKPAADGPRYKALGNSMAVPVMRWLGERIKLVHGQFQ